MVHIETAAVELVSCKSLFINGTSNVVMNHDVYEPWYDVEFYYYITIQMFSYDVLKNNKRIW